MARVNLTRDQLAAFLPNHEAVKAFEQLFQQVTVTTPTEIIELNILVNEALSLGGAADNKGDIALGLLANIANSLDLLAKAPVNQPVAIDFSDLQTEPRAELGTMAAQNADNVAITGGTLSGVAVSGFVVGPAVATDGNVALFDGVTGEIIKDGGTLGTAAFTSSAAYDVAGAAAAAQAASQPLDTQLTSIAALADAAGLLTNNGAGAFSYSAMGANVLTFLATPSSANLAAAVTGETGSGALVFATSPTLVTPTLGVAAATSINFGADALAYYDEAAWSATPTPAGGAFTTISFTGTYTRIGRRVSCNAVFHITNKGTAAGTLLIALPFTPAGSSPIFGWEDNVAAKAVSGSSTGSDVELRMVDGTTIYLNGANYVLFISFDI